MIRNLSMVSVALFLAIHTANGEPQAGNAGTVSGKVTDPSGAAIPKATVAIVNRLTNYRQETITDTSGTFKLINVPPAQYHFEANAPGFTTSDQDVDVRG